MKNFTLLLAFFAALILSGCGTKRQYFEPENVTAKISLSHSLPSPIASVNKNGATLNNGNVVTKKGLNTNVKLNEGFWLLNQNESRVISTNLEGELVITGGDGSVVYSSKFPTAIVAASTEGNLLAAVSAENHIYLIDISQARTLMEYKSSEIYAVDSRVASPLFMDTLVIFPSLDGKIYIVQKDSARILRDVVVSSEQFFNNVTFLDVVGENMIAATAKKVLVINPNKTLYYDGEIKDVLVNNADIYIFKKDGVVIKTDLKLQKKNEARFKFAIFSGAAITANNLFIVEKTGYVIKTDLNLSNPKIYEFDTEIKDKNFMGANAFYYDDEFVNFE